MLGVWKDWVSLYTTDPRHIKAFKQRHPSVKTGKASLAFRLSDEQPENDVREAVARALQLG